MRSSSSSVPDGHPVVALAPLENKCIALNAGWWTYEVCHLDRVRQFHTEKQAVAQTAPDGSTKTREVVRTVAEHLLGAFSVPHSRKAAVKELRVVHHPSDRRKTYASIWYEDGDKCDLTGKPRRTEVRISCDMDAPVAKVDSVTESSTCQYRVAVSGPELCVHEDFRPRPKPMRTIVCRPVSAPSGAASK